MRAIYCRSHAIGSIAIRTLDGLRRWSHCAGLVDDEHVIEARAFEGVVITPMADVIRRSSEWVMVERRVPDEAAGRAWARSTLGRPYDWLGAAGVPANRNWQDPAAWFCSEHLTMWEIKAGLHRFRPDTRGVSPNDSYMVADDRWFVVPV